MKHMFLVAGLYIAMSAVFFISSPANAGWVTRNNGVGGNPGNWWWCVSNTAIYLAPYSTPNLAAGCYAYVYGKQQFGNQWWRCETPWPVGPWNWVCQ